MKNIKKVCLLFSVLAITVLLTGCPKEPSFDFVSANGKIVVVNNTGNKIRIQFDGMNRDLPSDNEILAARKQIGTTWTLKNGEKIEIPYKVSDFTDPIYTPAIAVSKDDNYWYWVYLGKAYITQMTTTITLTNRPDDGYYFARSYSSFNTFADTYNNEPDKTIKFINNSTKDVFVGIEGYMKGDDYFSCNTPLSERKLLKPGESCSIDYYTRNFTDFDYAGFIFWDTKTYSYYYIYYTDQIQGCILPKEVHFSDPDPDNPNDVKTYNDGSTYLKPFHSETIPW